MQLPFVISSFPLRWKYLGAQITWNLFILMYISMFHQFLPFHKTLTTAIANKLRLWTSMFDKQIFGKSLSKDNVRLIQIWVYLLLYQSYCKVEGQNGVGFTKIVAGPQAAHRLKFSDEMSKIRPLATLCALYLILIHNYSILGSSL